MIWLEVSSCIAHTGSAPIFHYVIDDVAQIPSSQAGWRELKNDNMIWSMNTLLVTADDNPDTPT